MTKTETKLAEENIKNWEFTKPQDKSLWRLNVYLNKSQSHKASCKRFEEFLEDLGSHNNSIHRRYVKSCEFCVKITDLKNAIKKYDEVGI